jgi:A/G-specific adenine glycosylase
MPSNSSFYFSNQQLCSRSALQSWFKENQRRLPWRGTANIYDTWLCEIIMQQTRIDQGTAYWLKFKDRWPNVQALAEADLSDVLKAWQGLGYYSRARNLHRAANIIAFDLDGAFPENAETWRTIPGVGPYTAAAISSICFEEVIPAVDGNVIRVISRFLGIHSPIDRPEGRKELEAFAENWISPQYPGDHNQAVMELGALVCTPRKPDCDACPLNEACLSRMNTPGETPEPPIKLGKTNVRDVVLDFHVIVTDHKVWMRQRPAPGIWAGLFEFPSNIYPGERIERDRHTYFSPEPPWKSLISLGAIGDSFHHLLSHRKMHVQFWLWKGSLSQGYGEGEWTDWDCAEELALPRVLERSWKDVKNSALIQIR